MKKFIVETYYTCTFKTVHTLDNLNDQELSKIDNRNDGEVEVIDVKLNNRKTKKVGGKKGRVTPQDIASYVENNPNFILLDMGKHFKMSAAGAHYWLKKLGYSYKKSLSLAGS